MTVPAPQTTVTLPTDTPDDTLAQLNALGNGVTYERAAPSVTPDVAPADVPGVVADAVDSTPVQSAQTIETPATEPPAEAVFAASTEAKVDATVEHVADAAVADAGKAIDSKVPFAAPLVDGETARLVREIHGWVGDINKIVADVAGKLGSSPIFKSLGL